MKKRYESLNYPIILKKLYTPKCIEYRKKFNEKMHAYLERRVSQISSEKISLHDLSKEKNLIIPNETILNALDNPFDVITASGLKNDSSFLFLEDYTPNTQIKEGVGKTAILLKLFGARVPYEEIPSTAEELLQSDMKRIPFENREMRLISSDMLYIGINEGLLTVGPVKGEQIISQWDLARHIFRVKDPNYKSGKHREVATRNYLESIGATYYLDHDVFADARKSYSVDNIFLIKRKGRENSAVIRETSLQKCLKEIELTLMKNPSYHRSPFWGIDEREHKRRVKNIMKGLSEKRIPEIYRVSIPNYANRQKEEEITKKAAEKISQIL